MPSPKQHCVCVCWRLKTDCPAHLLVSHGKATRDRQREAWIVSFPVLWAHAAAYMLGWVLLMKSILYGAGTTNGVPFTSTATRGASILPVSIIRCARGMDWRCNKSLISFVTLWHFGHLCLGSVAFWGCLNGFSAGCWPLADADEGQWRSLSLSGLRCAVARRSWYVSLGSNINTHTWRVWQIIHGLRLKSVEFQE